jgi:F-type H+-transporting ATPase subunit gamma
MTTHVEGIATLANRLAEALYRFVAQGAIATTDIVFSRSVPGGLRIDRHSLLPLDLGRFTRPIDKDPPLIELAPDLLLDQLAAEYVYAQLCEAAMYAFVAENEARVSAMMAAKNNTERQCDGSTSIRCLVTASIHPPRMRRHGKTSACSPS